MCIIHSYHSITNHCAGTAVGIVGHHILGRLCCGNSYSDEIISAAGIPTTNHSGFTIDGGGKVIGEGIAANRSKGYAYGICFSTYECVGSL